MVEEYQSLREVSIALNGVLSRFDLFVKVASGAALIAAGVLGYLFVTTAGISSAVSKLDTKVEVMAKNIESIDPKISALGKDVTRISAILEFPSRRSDRSAQIPMPDAFLGYAGVRFVNSDDLARALSAAKSIRPVWLYSDDRRFLEELTPLPQGPRPNN